MKISFVTKLRLPEERGVSFFIVNMCRAFKKNGQDIELIVPRRRQNRNFLGVNFWKYYQIKPESFPISKLSCFELPKVRWLEFIFSHWRYLIISWTFSLSLVINAWKGSRTVVLLFNECREALFLFRLVAWWYRPFIIFEVHVPPVGAYERWLEKLALRRADLLVVITHHIANSYAKFGFSPQKIIVCPTAVDLESFDYKTSKSQLRHKLNLPSKVRIIGYGGRFTTAGQEKGIPDLVEAISILSRHFKDLLLVCVGGPREYVNIYQLLAQQKGLTKSQYVFLDHVTPKRLHQYMRAFDLCVMPFPKTRHYAYNMSPLKMFEYMASKNPLVATNLPVVREVLEHGRDAILVQANNPKSLAAGIKTLLEDQKLASKLASVAYEEVVTKYTLTTRAATITDAIASQYTDRFPPKLRSRV